MCEEILNMAVQISPGNVLCHHNKHLMGYFEYLHDLRILHLPLDIQKIALTASLRKARIDSDSSPSFLSIRNNTHTH